MLGRLLTDATIRSTLFIWNGAITPERLDAWALANRWRLPDDLRAFWVATGGGEMFESETMLGPFVDAVKGNAAHLTETDVVGPNQRYHGAGLDEHLLVFHEGLGVTCCDLRMGRYHLIEDRPPFQIRESYPNFADWYDGLIRAEYAARYGLPD